ncbi:MAG: hypothetical protein JWQ01_3579 [Massilia sp.]|jgi:hypothetical protein|nr:hypothetical protein [Massilia sp.]
MKKNILMLVPVLALLAGCGSTNSYLANKTSTVEMYHIFDIRTAAGTATVAKAAAEGLAQNTNDVNSSMPLQMGVAVPATPGRFTLVDIGARLGGTGLGAMMQMASMQNGGAGMKTANCEGAVWTARAVRTISGSSNLTLHGCLYRYQKGYHLDTYAVFHKVEGGLYQVSRDIAFKMVGTPEEWVTKTILDMVRSIEKGANAKVTHLEGQPELGDEPAISKLGQR